MKRCTRCNVTKPSTEFSFRKCSKDGRAAWCRNCFRDNWQKRYYTNHAFYKQKHTESRNRLREEKARKVFEYLKSYSCVDCGGNDPMVLEFDHRDRYKKFDSVTQLVLDNASWGNILSEIQKYRNAT